MIMKVSSSASNVMANLNRLIPVAPITAPMIYTDPDRRKRELKKLRDQAGKSKAAMKKLGQLSLSEDHNISADASFEMASASLEHPDPVNDTLLEDILERSPHHEDPHIHLSLSISRFLKGELKESAAHLKKVNENAAALRPDLDVPPALVDTISIAPESRVKKALLHRLVDENELTIQGKTVLNHTYGMLDMGGQIIEYNPTDKDITAHKFKWDGQFKLQDIIQDDKSFNCFFLGALASFTHSPIGQVFLRKKVLAESKTVPGRLAVYFKDVTVFLHQKIYKKDGKEPYSPMSKNWVNLALRAYDLFLFRTQKWAKQGVGMRGGTGHELYESFGLDVDVYDPVRLKVTEAEMKKLITDLGKGMPATLTKGNETHLYALVGYDANREAFVAYDPHGRFEEISYDVMFARFQPQSVHQRWCVYVAQLEA